MILHYSRLSSFQSFEERLDYLSLNGIVGSDTFGHNRFMNQAFYRSTEWKRVRSLVIVRDNGCDLGLEGFDIPGIIIVHHMNPISEKDILSRHPSILDHNLLVCVSIATHNAIHYGGRCPTHDIVERRPGDTRLW